MKWCSQGRWAKIFHRISKIRKGCVEAVLSYPLFKEGMLSSSCSGCCLDRFWVHSNTFHSFSKQRVLAFEQSLLLITLFIHMFKCFFLYFNLCPLIFDLSLGISEKSLALSSLFFAYQVCIHIDKIPLSLLVSWLNRHIAQPLLMCQRLQSLNYLCGPFWTLSSMSIFIWFAYWYTTDAHNELIFRS